LSWNAYSQLDVRTSVWKEKFEYWIPLVMNKNHEQRMKTLFKKSIANISSLGRSGEFHPEMALDILPKLMSTMVVNVMQEKLHASIKSLEAYCAFHRLLIMVVSDYPPMLKRVNDIISKFISGAENRTKSAIPSLGEFLPLLTVANYSWEDVAVAYLQENFDRNALWSLAKYPELEGSCTNDIRLRKSFDATQVSQRLLMFHVCFCSLVRPPGLSLNDIAANYDALMGRPSYHVRESLQKTIFQIQKVEYWPEFFKGIKVGLPNQEYMCNWLKRSIKNSALKRYHTPGRVFIAKA